MTFPNPIGPGPFESGQARIERCPQGVQLPLGGLGEVLLERISRDAAGFWWFLGFAHRDGAGSDYSFCLWPQATD
jgi:hypothetical protein